MTQQCISECGGIGRHKGNMKRKGKEKCLQQVTAKSGYKHVSTKPHGKYGLNKTFRVHREVALAFIDNPYNKPQVNHKNGNKTDNTLENLEWCTAKENAIHARDNGLTNPKKGEDHPSCKITDEEVLSIMEDYSNGKNSLRKLCKFKNITHQTVLRRFKNC